MYLYINRFIIGSSDVMSSYSVPLQNLNQSWLIVNLTLKNWILYVLKFSAEKYLQFLLSLHNDMIQVVEIIPRVRQRPI